MKIRIENYYLDGHECESTLELPDEPTAAEIEEEGGDWWAEYVYNDTGCGHGAPENTPSGRTMPATYTATVTEADNPALIGQSYEWSG